MESLKLKIQMQRVCVCVCVWSARFSLVFSGHKTFPSTVRPINQIHSQWISVCVCVYTYQQRDTLKVLCMSEPKVNSVEKQLLLYS